MNAADAELERRYSAIPWRRPIFVQRTDGACGYACRFCVARRGLKGSEIDALPKTEAEVFQHIAEVHA